jgi:hypothetical protein
MPGVRDNTDPWIPKVLSPTWLAKGAALVTLHVQVHGHEFSVFKKAYGVVGNLLSRSLRFR